MKKENMDRIGFAGRDRLTSLLRLMVMVTAMFCAVQTSAGADEKWRPVTPEELAMTAGKVDPNADAEAIFWEVTIDAGVRDKVTRETYARIKILSERVREQFAKIDLQYDTDDTKVKDLSARVIRPDGSAVEVPGKDIFEREILKADGFKAKALSFAFPNLEPGVIVEYRYREIFDGSGPEGMNLEFQLDWPAQVIRYLYRTTDGGKPTYLPFNLAEIQFEKTKGGFYQAERKNVPAFVREPNMIPERSVRPWVLLQANLRYSPRSAVVLGGIVAEASGPGINDPEAYWSRMAGEISNAEVNFGSRTSLTDKVAQEVTAGLSSNEEKVGRLYEFCRTEIKTVPPSNRVFNLRTFDADQVLKKLEGITIEKNLVFMALVRSLGLRSGSARMASRRSILFDQSMLHAPFLGRSALAVEIEPGVWKFYANSSFYRPGLLPWDTEGVWALVVDNKEHRWVTTPITPADKSLARRTGNFRLSSDGSLEGDVRLEYSGHPAAQIRIDYSRFLKLTSTEDPVTKAVRERMPQAVVSEVKYENEKDPEKPLVVNYKISIPKYAERTGKRLFVKPSFFEVGLPPVFSASGRKHPIMFPFPYSNQDEVNITLPEGFELDSADRPANVADPGNITSLKVSIGIELATRTIVYRRNFHFGGGKTPITRFEASSYGALKNLFDMFHKTDNHIVSLKEN